jgi:hypothetical protein
VLGQPIAIMIIGIGQHPIPKMLNFSYLIDGIGQPDRYQ